MRIARAAVAAPVMAAVGEPGGPIGGPALEARIAAPPPAVDDVPLAHPSAGRARTGHPARPVQADPALDAQRDVLRADRADPARTPDGGEEGEEAHPDRLRKRVSISLPVCFSSVSPLS